ncbi:MAG: ATP-dependent zinc metalloprotease FtsH [Firmicutes bacterium]|nr:ATP-dependent zinc metalloprotease FtsH [Candidatus Fiminaster equi]
MDENKNQQPRRGFGRVILPYLIIIAAIAAFIVLIVRATSAKVYKWNSDAGSLDKALADNQVVTAEVYNKETTVEITGTFYVVANPNDGEKQFDVVIDIEKYNHEFELEGGTHPAYSTLFEKEINDYKVAFPDKADRAYIKDVYAFQVSWWDQWGPSIISIIVTVLIAIILFSLLSRSVNGSNNKALDFNRSRARKIDSSKVKFADVAGCDEEKAEMVELVEYLKNPQKYTKFGAKLPKGILLVGQPGTGKTLLAKAVAGEAGVPFFSISGSDFVEMFVGVGAGRVRDMFRKAKQSAPCLVFIDEIDAVGRQRGAGLGGGNDEREQTLNQLLVEMDGFEDNSGIIVIAATNREDVLDPALLRAGRFDRTITVNLPDKAGREAIFKVHSRNKLIDPKVDFAQLAKRTVGFSGADIENIMNEAAILAVRNNEEMISVKDVDEAIDRRIAGPAKNSKGMNADERKRVAYHEAGHAIIGLKLPHSDKVQKITIIPRGRTGGHVLMTPEDDRFLLSKAELEARIIGFLGGRSSEEIFFDDVTTGASNDIEVATQIARSMVTEYGMSSLGPIQYEKDTGSVFLGRDYTSTQKNFSTQIAFEIDQEVRKIIDEAHKKAQDIIKANKADVIKIAETLLEKETITAEEIDAVLAGKKVEEQPLVEETKPVEKKPAAKKAPAKKAPAKKPAAKKAE